MNNGMDFYAIEPASAGLAAARVKRIMEGVGAVMVSGMEQRPEAKPYEVVGGVAVMAMRGLMVASALPWELELADMSRIESGLKAAGRDPEVSSILISVDSPGGQVTGTISLSDTVAAVNKIKPITAHIGGVGASAGYWVASQAGKVTADRMARIGAIGVVDILYDDSAAALAAGIKPVVIETSPLKSMGMPGVPVSAEMVEEAKRIVAGYMEAFTASIKAGRGIDPKTVATGQTWFAKDAKALGLIDRIATFDETLTAMIEKNNATAKARTAQARGRMALLD